MPAGGWDAAVRGSLLPFQGVGLLLVALCVSLVYLVSSRQARLGLAEWERTAELGHKMAELEQMAAQLRRVNRALKTLSACSQALVHETDELGLLREVCRVCVEIGGYRLAWVGYAEQDEQKSVRPVASAGYDDGYLDLVKITWADTERGRGPTGKPVVGRDLQTLPHDDARRAEAIKRGYASSIIALPLMAQGLPLGALTLYAGEPGAFDSEEIESLTELADDLAYGMMALRTQAEHQRAEEEIHSLARFPAENPNPVMRVDQDGIILYANEASRPLLQEWGCEVGSPAPEFWRDLVAEALATRETRSAEVTCEERVYSFIVGPVGEAGYANLYGRDVTERKLAEEALRESENKFRTLFNSASDGIFIHDMQGHFLEVNQMACERLGCTREEMLQMTLMDIDTPEFASRIPERMAELTRRGQVVFETAHRRRDGTVIPIEASVRIIEYRGAPAMLSIARDISERKRLEQQFLVAQKMDVVGRLAGGVAHEFNNMLTSVMGYAGFARRGLLPGDPARDDIDQVLSVSERLADLTRRLLAFSRRQIIQPSPLNLNDLIAHLAGMLDNLPGKNLARVNRLAPELGLVEADPGQIEQVLLNLAVNAIDAMPNGGTLTIETANIALSEDDIQGHGDMAPGEYVMLAVTDTGLGMTEEVKAHLFEPFFTTKEVGQGTGLGLAAAYGIVKQHGGDIWVFSEAGHGARFEIYLPRLKPQPPPLPLQGRGRGLGPIQPPHPDIQRRRKRHPQKIGDQQPPGDRVQPAEAHQRRQNQHPQHHDLDQRPTRAVQAEEQHRPQQVEHKLDREQRHRQAHARLLPAPPPYQVERHAHQNEQQRPHRPEQPIRRRPGRLLDRPIPRGNRRPGRQRAQATHDQRDKHRHDETGHITHLGRHRPSPFHRSLRSFKIMSIIGACSRHVDRVGASRLTRGVESHHVDAVRASTARPHLESGIVRA